MTAILCWLFGHKPLEVRTSTTFRDWFDTNGVPITFASQWRECRRCGKRLSDCVTRTTQGVEQ